MLSEYLNATSEIEKQRLNEELKRLTREANATQDEQPIKNTYDSFWSRGWDKQTSREMRKVVFSFVGGMVAIVFCIWSWGKYLMKQDERQHEREWMEAEKNRTPYNPMPTAPLERRWGSQPATYNGSAYRSADYGVTLQLEDGTYLYTGLDESEILDQIAADGDIYSLTDYFDEYVGD